MAIKNGKKTKIMVANWKMNPAGKEEAASLFSALKRIAKPLTKINLIICPPALYLGFFKKPEAKNVHLGAQNIFWEHSGSFTGEMSTEMLKNADIKYVIVGHSERRKLGETVEMVNKKLLAALKDGLTPILCIGETARDSSGEYLEFLTNEIRTALTKVSKQNLDRLIIAYEPVWAIGKSEREAMTPNLIHEMTIFIKKVLSDLYGQEDMAKVPILYGGSVGPSNAQDIIEKGEVSGLLVGRQSLDAKAFKEILSIVNSN